MPFLLSTSVCKTANWHSGTKLVRNYGMVSPDVSTQKEGAGAKVNFIALFIKKILAPHVRTMFFVCYLFGQSTVMSCQRRLPKSVVENSSDGM